MSKEEFGSVFFMGDVGFGAALWLVEEKKSSFLGLRTWTVFSGFCNLQASGEVHLLILNIAEMDIPKDLVHKTFHTSRQGNFALIFSFFCLLSTVDFCCIAMVNLL